MRIELLLLLLEPIASRLRQLRIELLLLLLEPIASRLRQLRIELLLLLLEPIASRLRQLLISFARYFGVPMVAYPEILTKIKQRWSMLTFLHSDKRSAGGGGSVSDPYSFFPDPDPEVVAGDQYGSGSNTDPDPIRIQDFNDQKLKKNNSWKGCKGIFILGT
jgi:hypothetical protein